MISLSLARQLKKAGLKWQPQLHDAFAIPDRAMDERRFILTDVMTYIERFRGSPMVTFHGTAEWALDYILQTEAVWVPSESQMREMVAERVSGFALRQTPEGYECSAEYEGEQLSFSAPKAGDAYASLLLQLLLREVADPDAN